MTDRNGELVVAIDDDAGAEADEFEAVLEILAAKARVKGRRFLAYLLTMALMEARGEGFWMRHQTH